MGSQYFDTYHTDVRTNGIRLKASEPLIVDSGGTVTLPSTTTIGGSPVTSFNGVITAASANALAAGPNGTTNPTFNVDTSTASAATGLNVKGAAAAAGLAVSVVSSGTNENLTLDAKGSGTVTVNGTATGAITLARATNVTGAVIGTSTSANALAIGANGSTNPVLNVDASTASVATGLQIKGAAAAAGVALTVQSSGATESISVAAKGAAGVVSLQGGAVNILATSGTWSGAEVGQLNIGDPSGGTNISNTRGGDVIFAAATNIKFQIPGGSGILKIAANIAPAAGGSTASGFQISSTANLGVFTGSGVPTMSAAQGSLYIRTDGSSTSTRLYVNTNGSTTWTNVVTAA